MKICFTGEWPPYHLWERYRNWEYALDEESVPGQDETTLRPSSQQSSIDRDVAYTTGEVVQANGTRLPAILELNDCALCGVTVFTEAADGWSVRLLGDPAKWWCITQEWLPPEQRSPFAPPDDTDIFPLYVYSDLSIQDGGEPVQQRILPLGTA